MRLAEDRLGLERVRALVYAGHPADQIVEFLADDPPAMRAYASAAVSLHGAKAPKDALNDPAVRRELAQVRVLVERAAEQHLPTEQQIAREAERQLELGMASVTRHTAMIADEVNGRPVDRVAIGLADAMVEVDGVDGEPVP